MSWDLFDWGGWTDPELGGLGSGSWFDFDGLSNSWQPTMPSFDNWDAGVMGDSAAYGLDTSNAFTSTLGDANGQWDQFSGATGGGEGAVGWDAQGNAQQYGSSPVGSLNAQAPGSGVGGLWENIQKGLQDPRNLARIGTAVAGGVASRASRPGQISRRMDNLTQQTAQQQADFANQQAANYTNYRVPLQRQITSAASFLGTPEDIENFTAKKMADVNAANTGAMERLKRYGQATGRNVGGEMRRQGQDVARQQVDARNRGMQERMDWALGQQMNAARLWGEPNYNPGLYGTLGASYGNQGRQFGQDIGRGLGTIFGYDPEEANRNKRSTDRPTPDPYQWLFGG